MVALNDLLSRPWFTRVWTLQEAAQAKEAIVVCGRKQMPFQLFEEFNRKCQGDDTGIWTDTLSLITSAKPANVEDPPRFLTAHIHDIWKLKRIRSETGARESITMLLSGLRRFAYAIGLML